MYSDLLFYEMSDGVAEVYRTKDGSIDIDRHEAGWGNNWTHMVNGYFGFPGLSQLILYDAGSGTIRIETVVRNSNGPGAEMLVHEIPNWRPGWSQMVVVGLGEPPNQLLFYDAVKGLCESYNLSSSSPWLSLVHQFSGFGQGIEQIVPGNFGGGAGTDVLFYEAATGSGTFYRVNNDSMHLLNNISGAWRKTWKQIVPGNFDGSQQTGLLFYDPGAQVGEFYSVENGTIHLLEANTGWQSDWDLIVPGHFSDGQYADLLFYSRSRGVGQFYRTNHGAIAQIALYTDWRHTWTQILGGTFAAPPATTKPPVQPIVIPSLVVFDPQNDSYLLQLKGSGFAPNESVSLQLTWQDQNMPPQDVTPTPTTQADGSGAFVYKYSGSGGGVCVPFRRWTVVGIGLNSKSSPVSAGCSV